VFLLLPPPRFTCISPTPLFSLLISVFIFRPAFKRSGAYLPISFLGRPPSTFLFAFSTTLAGGDFHFILFAHPLSSFAFLRTCASGAHPFAELFPGGCEWYEPRAFGDWETFSCYFILRTGRMSLCTFSMTGARVAWRFREEHGGVCGRYSLAAFYDLVRFL
jgi:hypothetical protein